MLSALMMLRRVLPALRYATREEEFGPIFGAGVLLVVIGTLTYSARTGTSSTRSTSRSRR
jgi:hypothetical protein